MKKILNVGCGNSVYGTHFVDLYPTRKNVIKCDVDKNKLPFPTNTFDEVFAQNLFEHLTNPLFALKEMKRVLKPGGKLIIITDYAHFWGFSITGHKIRYKKFGKEEHLLLVNEHHLQNWFKKVNLKVVKIDLLEASEVGGNILIKILKKLLATFLKITPFRRMAFSRIKIVGKK